MLQRFKKHAEREIEHLRRDLRHLEQTAQLRRQYSTPLLKASEDLYNKLNDIVGNRDHSLGLFRGLADAVQELKSIGDILGSRRATYLTTVLYQFARFWACVEAIKKDMGIMELSSAVKTKTLHARIRQVGAVFPSGRLHRGLKTRQGDRLRFEGRILGGAQILIAEMVLAENRNASECISYYQFCQRLVSDSDFRESLTPLLSFLSDLTEVAVIDREAEDLDFRWLKIIVLGSFLRKLVYVLDEGGIISLLPEFEDYEESLIGRNEVLRENIAYFTQAYPDPE